MLVYSGCDLEHWREEFKGKDCCQVFLHYNKDKNKQNYLDTRPLLGLPPIFSGSPYLNLTKSPSVHWPSAPVSVTCLLNPGAICTFVNGIKLLYTKKINL